jgi:hypothetical protein
MNPWLSFLLGVALGGSVVWFYKNAIIADFALAKQKAEADLVAIRQAAKAKGINL